MSYSNLAEAKPFVNPKTGVKGEPQFSVEMLLQPDDLAAFAVRRGDAWEDINVRNAMGEVAKNAWPDLNIKEAVKHGGLGWPLKNGDAKKAAREANGKKGDAYAGTFVLPVKSKQELPPQLYVVDNGKIVELDRYVDKDMSKIKQLFASGNFAKANVNVRAVETHQGKYITFYVNAVIFVEQGDRIGGMTAEDRFGGIEGGMADVDPTAGVDLDDEIAF